MSETAEMDIKALLMTLEPIASFSPELVAGIADQAKIQNVQAGEQLYPLDADDNNHYFLIDGSVEVETENGEKQTLSTPSERTKHALNGNEQPISQATAITACKLVTIDHDILDNLLTWAQFASDDHEVVMTAEGTVNIDKAALMENLHRSPTFRNLPPANIEALLERMEPMVVHSGDVIISQGDHGDYFYVITEGEALVTREIEEGDEITVELAELKEGASFGEAALLSDKPRNATVSMVSDGGLLRLNKNDFITLLKEPSLVWLNASEAKTKVAAGARWVDVRTPEEYKKGHLANAINLPLNDIHRYVKERLNESGEYICYCQTGRRSSAAAFILSQQYSLNTSALKGGLDANIKKKKA